MKLHRHFNSTACAIVLAATCFSAAAATPATVMTPQQAQYVRMHQTTTAFINAVDLSSERQG